MKEHEKLSQGEELLTQILEECMEEDLSFVPPEGEIARTHRFSEVFEQSMQELLDLNARRSGEKEIRRHFTPRYGQWAACILVFCVCGWLFYQAGGMTGGSGMEESADSAPAEISDTTESAADDMSDAGSGSIREPGEASDAQSAASQENESQINEVQKGREYCGSIVYPADVQQVPDSLADVTTRVNCPVLDEDDPVLMLTIGNTGEEDIRYLNRYALEVWLEDAWYRIPAESEEPGQWLILEAGMAVDEEIDLSGYQMDYDASQYRLVTHVGQGMLSVEFTFGDVFKKTMEESGAE